MKDLLEKQMAFIDAQEIARTIGREFTEADIVQYEEHGVDLMSAAEYFVEKYEGSNRFVKNVLVDRLKTWHKLTQGQARAALNIMRQEILGIERPKAPEKDLDLECFACDKHFPTWDALNAHKSQDHGRGKDVPETFTDAGDAKDVLEVMESKKGLDLSNMPDGRFAIFDASGRNDNIFLMVKRVRRTVKRDRRYMYGKVVTGNEIVVAGTIEVRIWSSDTKEWVGQQKPGDVYRGKYEDELELIMLNPELFATLFGKLVGHCGMCGKTLTDEVSREIGLGLDCEKKKAEWAKPRYSYVGTDRPDADKANPLDDKYLSGELRRWIDPPKVTVREPEVPSSCIVQAPFTVKPALIPGEFADMHEMAEALKGQCVHCGLPASVERKVAPLMKYKNIIHLDCAEEIGVA